MKSPYSLSQKGWKHYAGGNTLATYSCILIAFTLVAAIFIVMGLMVPNLIDPLIMVVCAVVIVAFNLLAMVAIFVGRLLRWKGLTLMLSAAQLTDTVVVQNSAEDTNV